ncbi:MAG: dihydroorotate dehydrogenase electron transfer subunit [Chloroflexota bacterium]|nr:dihydroorotate dehydrogenase electron transfer subunit [Chloroflexota bacterium]
MSSQKDRQGTLPQTVRIREIRDETRTIRTFVLDADIPEAEPGQFIMLWLPGVDEKPISIAHPAPLTLTVARVGSFSTALHGRRVGDQVGWRGPYGRGFSLCEDQPALLVAGGYGAAPLYFLADRAVERCIPTTVALGARTALDLLYVEQFRALGVDLLLATDDGSLGHRGYITDAILHSPLSPFPPAIYACGPEQMLVAIHRLCRERSIPGQLSVERYIKCGFGICGQCAMDGLLVCQDGPVFEVEQLDGLRDFGHVHRSATGRRLPIQ